MTLARPLLAACLVDLALCRVPAHVRGWLDEAAGLDGDAGGDTTAAALAIAARHVGRARVGLDEEEQERLADLGVTWAAFDAGLDVLVRVAILVAASARLEQPVLEGLVERSYEAGDTRERVAILRALPLLSWPERFVGLALDGCRSPLLPVFEAIACDTPYPAEHLHEVHFNQMVLRALRGGVALDRIVGLDARLGPELARLAAAFAAQRRRDRLTVPRDLLRLYAGQTRAA